MTNQIVTHESLERTVRCALFCALIVVGGYLSIPIGPVPIAFADFFVMVAALVLGPRGAVTAVLLYVGLGALGLPVFAGGKAGLAVLVGPTGGFVAGYALMAAVAGFVALKGRRRLPALVGALVAGNAALYAAGVAWLKLQMGIGWDAAVAAGLLPFLPGLLLKAALACVVARQLACRAPSPAPTREPFAPAAEEPCDAPARDA